MASAGRATTYTPDEIERFNTDKKYFLEYRKKIQNSGSATYALYYKHSDMQKKLFAQYTDLMKQRLKGNEELCSKLIPKFHVGCRR